MTAHAHDASGTPEWYRCAGMCSWDDRGRECNAAGARFWARQPPFFPRSRGDYLKLDGFLITCSTFLKTKNTLFRTRFISSNIVNNDFVCDAPSARKNLPDTANKVPAGHSDNLSFCQLSWDTKKARYLCRWFRFAQLAKGKKFRP